MSTDRRIGIALPSGASPAVSLDVNGKVRISDDINNPLPGTLRYTPASGFEGYHSGTWSSMVYPTSGSKWLVGPLSTVVLSPSTEHQIVNYAFHIQDIISNPQIQDHYEVPADGTYMLHMQVSLIQNGTSNTPVDNGIVELKFKRNGNPFPGAKSRYIIDLIKGNAHQVEKSIMVQLSKGDEVSFHITSFINQSGVDISLTAGNGPGTGFDTLLRAYRIE